MHLLHVAIEQKNPQLYGGIIGDSLIYNGNVSTLSLLLDVTVALLEAVNAACGINELAFTGIEWVRGV